MSFFAFDLNLCQSNRKSVSVIRKGCQGDEHCWE
jgi:hypothetical protein